MPGMGIDAKTRKTARAPATNRSRLRNAESESSRVSFCVKAPILLYGTASLLYFCARGGGNTASGDGKLFSKCPVAKHLNSARIATHKPALGKHRHVYGVTRRKISLEHGNVYDVGLRSEERRVGKECRS